MFGKVPYSIEKLRKSGVIVGENVYIGTRKIDLDHGFLLEIGNNVTLSDCRILLHDASIKMFLGYSKVGKGVIGDNVFIGADAIILPNFRIGNNVIIGAGAVVAKNIPDNSIAVGNPIRIIGSTSEYIRKNENMIKLGAKVYKTYCSEKTEEEKKKMRSELSNGEIGFDI